MVIFNDVDSTNTWRSACLLSQRPNISPLFVIKCSCKHLRDPSLIMIAAVLPENPIIQNTRDLCTDMCNVLICIQKTIHIAMDRISMEVKVFLFCICLSRFMIITYTCGQMVFYMNPHNRWNGDVSGSCIHL